MLSRFVPILVAYIVLSYTPFNVSAQTANYLEVFGRIENSGQPVNSGTVRILLRGNIVESLPTAAGGRFSFSLPIEDVYVVEFMSPGLVTKRLQFDTRLEGMRVQSRYFEFDMLVDLFPSVEGIDFTFFNEPLATISYKEDIRRFFFREMEAAPRLRRAHEIHLQVIDLIRRRELYATTIQNADRYFNMRNWDLARGAYQQARGILPDETYPVQQLAEIERLVAQNQDIEGQYNNLIASGDRDFALGLLNEARTSYVSASQLRPDQQYPRQRITEIDQRLAREQELTLQYNRLIQLANTDFTAGNFSSALTHYQNASNLRPNETFPRDRIREINAMLANTARIEQEYNNFIARGDAEFSARRLETSKEFYLRALEVKPSETYPRQRIEEIDRLLAERQLRERQQAEQLAANQQLEQQQAAEQQRLAQERAAEQQRLEQQRADEQRRLEAERLERERAAAEQQRLAQERTAAEQQRLAQERAAEAARQQQLRLAEQQHLEQQRADEQRRLEAERLERERVAAEQQRLAQERAAEATRQEQLRLAEAQRLEQQRADEQRRLEAERLERERVAAEQQRLAQERAAEATRQEQLRLAEAQRLEQQRADEQRRLEAERLERERAAAEQQRLAQERAAEAARQEQQRLELARQAEAQRIANEASERQRREEEQRLASQRQAEQQALDTRYNEIITAADRAFASRVYARAIEMYREAIALKPQEQYPRTRLAEATRILDQMNVDALSYDRLIETANSQFGQRQFAEARTNYTRASEMRPNETFPRQRIAEIDRLMAGELDENVRFTNAVRDGDRLFVQRQFFAARDAYQLALVFRPDDVRSINRIIEINSILAASQEMEAFYARGHMEVSNVREIVKNNVEKRFHFVPFDRRRTGSHLSVTAVNGTGNNLRLFINYGKDNQRSGGFSVSIGSQTGAADLRINISDQMRWITEENNWISITPVGGDIDIHSIKIHFGP